jgi:hypothetical protein
MPGWAPLTRLRLEEVCASFLPGLPARLEGQPLVRYTVILPDGRQQPQQWLWPISPAGLALVSQLAQQVLLDVLAHEGLSQVWPPGTPSPIVPGPPSGTWPSGSSMLVLSYQMLLDTMDPAPPAIRQHRVNYDVVVGGSFQPFSWAWTPPVGFVPTLASLASQIATDLLAHEGVSLLWPMPIAVVVSAGDSVVPLGDAASRATALGVSATDAPAAITDAATNP